MAGHTLNDYNGTTCKLMLYNAVIKYGVKAKARIFISRCRRRVNHAHALLIFVFHPLFLRIFHEMAFFGIRNAVINAAHVVIAPTV